MLHAHEGPTLSCGDTAVYCGGGTTGWGTAHVNAQPPATTLPVPSRLASYPRTTTLKGQDRQGGF